MKICTYAPPGTSQSSIQTPTANTPESQPETSTTGQQVRTTGTNGGAVVSMSAATTHKLASQTCVTTAHSSAPTQATAVSWNVNTNSLSGVRTYGQKLAMFQQQQKLQSTVATSATQFVVSSSTPGVSAIPLTGGTRTTSTGVVNRKSVLGTFKLICCL